MVPRFYYGQDISDIYRCEFGYISPNIELLTYWRRGHTHEETDDISIHSEQDISDSDSCDGNYTLPDIEAITDSRDHTHDDKDIAKTRCSIQLMYKFVMTTPLY